MGYVDHTPRCVTALSAQPRGGRQLELADRRNDEHRARQLPHESTGGGPPMRRCRRPAWTGDDDDGVVPAAEVGQQGGREIECSKLDVVRSGRRLAGLVDGLGVRLGPRIWWDDVDEMGPGVGEGRDPRCCRRFQRGQLAGAVADGDRGQLIVAPWVGLSGAEEQQWLRNVAHDRLGGVIEERSAIVAARGGATQDEAPIVAGQMLAHRERWILRSQDVELRGRQTVGVEAALEAPARDPFALVGVEDSVDDLDGEVAGCGEAPGEREWTIAGGELVRHDDDPFEQHRAQPGAAFSGTRWSLAGERVSSCPVTLVGTIRIQASTRPSAHGAGAGSICSRARGSIL